MLIKLILIAVGIFVGYIGIVVHKQRKNYTKFPPTMQFILAVTYFANRACSYNYRSFGGGKLNEKSKLEGLNEAWNIHNEQELLDQVNVLVECGHRSVFDDYLEDEIEFKGKPTEEIKDKIMATRARLVSSHTGTLAWDLCRAVQILGWGYRVGYIQYEKAYLLSLEICKIMQENFVSWAHMVDSYVMGAFYWSEHARYTNKIIGYFDEGLSSSLFNIEWYTPLDDEIIYDLE